MGKYLSEVFVQTERRRRRVCAYKTEGKYFPVQTEQTKLIRNLLYGFWFLPSSLLINELFSPSATLVYLLVFYQ